MKNETFAELYELQYQLNDALGCHMRTFPDLWEKSPSLRFSDPRFGYSRDRVLDYRLALLAELFELMNCVNWKHWTKETREGRRWEILDQQNLLVELIDILFFMLSLQQAFGLPNRLPVQPELEYYKNVSIGQEICLIVIDHWLKDISALPLGCNVAVHDVEYRLMPLYAHWLYIVERKLRLSDDDIVTLYTKKWRINLDRNSRGGRPHGDDEQCEDENKQVTL